jgi:hypothetical protein
MKNILKFIEDIEANLKELSLSISKDDKQPVEQVDQNQYVDVKTADGKILRCLADVSFQVGAIVSIMNEDGSVIPAPTGEYILQDGTKYEIQDGTIINIMAPEMPEQEVEVEVENQTKTVKQAIEDKPEDKLILIIDEMKNEINALQEKIKSLENEKVELNSKIKNLGEQPAALPIQKTDKKTDMVRTPLRTSEVLNSFIGKRK